MSNEAHMKQALNSYLEAFNAGDVAGIVALYADDATVEDPVGTEVRSGRKPIEEFYGYAVATGAKLRLDSPIRASRSNFAAMAFTVSVNHEGHDSQFRVIDVMSFDENGKIASMRAFWGESDIVQM
ncbi:MAG: steroid Delta-isomerase [Pseudomonas sp.]